ncbi:uncharacterized protein LOC127867140 [Dreissena polymorpha]|nr:uncharacterized protein LOC127867140 [Dreissena polymorpha]
MAKVEDILTRYVEVFDDVTLLDEKTLKADVNKSIAEIERIVGNAAFDAFKPKGASETVDIEKRKADPATKKLGKDARAVQIPFTKTLPEVHKLTVVPSLEQEPLHVCKKHVDDTLTEQTFQRLGGQFRSVGAVVCKNMAWTAFRVGSSYVMTTAHAVRDIVDPDRKGNSDWSVLEDTGVYLTFDSPLKPDCIKFRLNSQVCYLDDDLNVAVLEVLDSPESFPPPVVLSRKHLPSQDVTDVAVIGYGHGKSQSKHLDIQCDLVKPISERANEALRWLKREERKQRCSLHVKGKDASLVTWHYNEMKDPTRVAIDCCMEYRAHGAPVFCNTGPSGVEVLAILTSSSPECFSEMPRSVQEHHKEYRFEIATLTSAIYTKLAHETRFLAEDIFIRDKNYYDYSKYEVETTFSSTDGSRTMSDVTEYLGTPVSGTADRTMTSSTIRTASTIENK